MNRLLLTLLALLTGVVAQVTPAATVSNSSATEIGSSEVQVAGQFVAVATVGFSQELAIRPHLSHPPVVRLVEQMRPVRTVLTGIDRARE